jgi:ketosteroid isomerase-like protein
MKSATYERTAAEEDRVRDAVEAMWSAISAKNVDGVVSCCTPDFVQFSMAPPLRTIGPDATALAAWFATWRGPIGHESRELGIAVGGDVAYCTSVDRMTGTKTDGVRVDLWFRSTLGLRQVDGRWLIAHEHESVPFYMDGSYRASIDLLP